MGRFIGLFVFCFSVVHVSAQDTWSDNVAQIFYNNCTSCHNPNGIAPFSLITYKDVKPFSASIETAVFNNTMPPWIADSKYQKYAHERVLSFDEKVAITNWLKNGGPEGDASKTPPPPVYKTKGFISEKADLEIKLPVYSSKASATGDDYVCFSMPTGLTSTKKIRGFEVIPGNHAIVHHSLVYIDPTGNYPTDTSAGVCTGPTTGLIGGYVPGSPPTVFPTNGSDFNLGFEITAGSNIVLAMHYPEGSYGKVDSTIIRFWFYDDATPIRKLQTSSLIENWQFVLPANKETEVSGSRKIGNVDYSILSVFPHMHLLGKRIGSFAITPTQDTIPFVSIPHWNFEWQEFLFFEKMKKLPKGSTIYGEGRYDNTVNNLHNPSNPPKTVYPGLNTTDEMFLIYFHYLPYQDGDENRDIEKLTTLSNFKVIPPVIGVYPNPASNEVTFTLPETVHKNVQIRIYNSVGSLVTEVINTNQLDSSRVTWSIPENVTPGLYYYSANVEGTLSSGSLVIK